MSFWVGILIIVGTKPHLNGSACFLLVTGLRSCLVMVGYAHTSMRMALAALNI